MKNLLFITLLLISLTCWADNPNPDINPPPPQDKPGHGHGHGGHGAPIDGGLGILLVMGVVYSGKKLYKAKKLKENGTLEG